MSKPLLKLGPVRIIPSEDGQTRINWRPAVAAYLYRLAHRIDREPLHTLTVTVAGETKTFIDCRLQGEPLR